MQRWLKIFRWGDYPELSKCPNKRAVDRDYTATEGNKTVEAISASIDTRLSNRGRGYEPRNAVLEAGKGKETQSPLQLWSGHSPTIAMNSAQWN